MVEPSYGCITSSNGQSSAPTTRVSRIFLMSNHKTTPHTRLRALLDERWSGSDEAFAGEIPMTPGHFSKLVNGHTNLRTSRKLERIAELLGTTPDYIISGVESGESSIGGNAVLERDPGPWADSFIGYAEAGLERRAITETGPPNIGELVASAYGTAIRNRWPLAEIEELELAKRQNSQLTQ